MHLFQGSVRRLNEQEVQFLQGESKCKLAIFRLSLQLTRPCHAPAEVFDKFDEEGTGKVHTTQLEAMLDAIGRNPGEGACAEGGLSAWLGASHAAGSTVSPPTPTPASFKPAERLRP